jgi:hypothetical protein
MSRLTGLAAGIVIVVFVAGALRWFVPSLTLERQTVDSTPSLQGLFIRSEVVLPGGGRACIAPLPLDRGVREVQLLLHARGKDDIALDVSLRAPRYAATTQLTAGATGSDVLASGRLSSVPTDVVDGTMCIRNRGRHSVALVGTSEPESQTIPQTTVNGTLVKDVDPAVTFLTGERRDILSEAGTVMDRIAGFTGVVPAWLLWPLTILFVLGVPVAAAAALVLSARRT